MGIYTSILRNLALPPILRRENRQSALKHWRFLRESQFWPRQKLLDYQWIKIKQLIEYAYRNTPYYKELFDRKGILPESIKDFSDLSRIPILTRDIIFERLDDLKSTALDSSHTHSFTTGGTTGQKAVMCRDQESFNIKLAVAWRFEGWMGRMPCDKMALYWPAHIDFTPQKSWKETIKTRHFLREVLYYSGMYDEPTLRRHYDSLMKFSPDYFKAFPSALYGLTDYIENKKLPVPSVRGIMSTGEVLYDFQRGKFENLFDCPVYDMYGSREVGNSACQCELRGDLHIAMETTYIEFLEEGRPVDYGQEGEIIITDLTNYAMPVIRYRINDYGIPVKESCSCGRESQMMSSAIGRVSDDFWSPDGIRHSGNVLGYHLTGDEQNIGQLQVVQKSLTDFLIRITNKPEPTPEVFEFIRNKMHKIIGDNINIKIDVVEHLEKEKSGKLRLVKCEINPPEEFRLKRTGRAGN